MPLLCRPCLLLWGCCCRPGWCPLTSMALTICRACDRMKCTWLQQDDKKEQQKEPEEEPALLQHDDVSQTL